MILAENELVPYITSYIPDGPWLTFAPHADDETFGLGGSMLLAKQKNIETNVVFVTDGALGGGGSYAGGGTGRAAVRAQAVRGRGCRL